MSSQHAHANRLLSDEIDRPAFDPPTTLEHGDFVTSMKRTRQGDYTFSTSFSNQPPEGFHIESVIAIEPLRQYLATFPGGRLQVLDVAYDPRSNEWFNMFGEENRQPHEWGFWKNRSMTWNVQCAFCHTTGFEKHYDIPTDSYASTWQAMGISCAQCHNVKEQHAAGSPPPAPHECPMLEPQIMEGSAVPVIADIPTNRIVDNCASCHARREELFGTFKAGDDFHDHFRLVLPDAPGIFHPDGQVLDEDFEYASFMMSRMGHKGVTCLDCHNPHSGKLVMPFEFNALCMQCHSPPGFNQATPINPVDHVFHELGTEGSRCVDCHMPIHYYMVRDGRRDHGFTSPDPRLTIEHGIPNACNMCHTDQTAEWAERWTDTWYGDKMDRRARDRARVVARTHEGDPAVASDLLAMAQTEEIAAWRATLVSLLGRWSQREEITAFLIHELTHEHPLVRSAAVRALQEQPDALTLLTPMQKDSHALVRVDAAWATLRGSRPLNPSIRELAAYLNNVADQPAGALLKAQYAISEGNLPAAEAWAEKALAWDPMPLPRYALGRIQHLSGKMEAAVSNMTQAARAESNNVEYSFSLALLHGELGQHDETIYWLNESVQRDPQFGRAWYNLGLAYAQANQLDQAIHALRMAEQTSPPGAPEPAYALATIYVRQGAVDQAIEAAKRALAANPTHAPSLRFLESVAP